MKHFVYFFPFIFAGMWVLVTFVLSKLGWANLATPYLFDRPFEGKRVGVITASINNVNYKNSLILKYNEEGIYLRPVVLFRLFHKPVLIPWKEIKEVRTKKVLFISFKELIVGHPFVAVIGLNQSTFNKIAHQIATERDK